MTRRGYNRISMELLMDILDIPDDFKASGCEFDFKTNSIKLYGYSETYPDFGESESPE